MLVFLQILQQRWALRTARKRKEVQPSVSSNESGTTRCYGTEYGNRENSEALLAEQRWENPWKGQKFVYR